MRAVFIVFCVFQITAFCFFSMTLCGFSAAQEQPPLASEATSNAVAQDDGREKQILALRESLTNAVAEKNVDALLQYLHPDFVLTAQDGLKLSVIRKQAGVREYFERLFKGDEATLKSVRANIVVDEVQQLPGGDLALANGSSDDHFVMRSGGEYDLESRWSTTVVKHEGVWKLMNLHVSCDIFDNPIFNAAKSSLVRVGSMGVLIGLVVGLLISKLFSRRSG